jgi:hypothetical protein
MCLFRLSEALRSPETLFTADKTTSNNHPSTASKSSAAAAVVATSNSDITTNTKKPDTCTFTDYLLDVCAGSNNIYDGFTHFKEHATEWNTVSANKRADITKCRYMHAVNDASHVGLLSLQANGNVIRRLAYSWIAET